MADSRSSHLASDFIDFLNASPTPFHAVHSAKARLEKAGFKQIRERDPWSSTLKPGGKYYLTRNGSTIIAFAIGLKWRPGNPVGMIAAHTDSCVLRVKPVSKQQADGFLQVGVETYGGGMWHTWFDRDLSIAGRAMVKSQDGIIQPILINVGRPILRIPTLAVHFGREASFKFDPETQLLPIAGLAAAELNRRGSTATEKQEPESKSKGPSLPLNPMDERHHPFLIDLLAKEAHVSPEQIVDFEMTLYDTQKACFGGLNDELIYSARLDNLGMSYCAVEGIIASLAASSALENDSTVRLISLFDHEEIGSTSAQGAESNILPGVLRRLSVVPSSSDAGTPSKPASEDSSYESVAQSGDSDDISTAYEQTCATSFLVSADMAHSINPNYSSRYETNHKSAMNAGTVIKVNANQKYATNSPGIVLIQEVARLAKPSTSPLAFPQGEAASQGVPLQLTVVANGAPCGSTVGPGLAAALGTRTLDLGNPQLSMHSIRETGGALDVEHGVNLFESFFDNFEALEKKILVDEVDARL